MGDELYSVQRDRNNLCILSVLSIAPECGRIERFEWEKRQGPSYMRLAYGIFLRSHAFDDHIEAIYISFGSETPVDVIITS